MQQFLNFPIFYKFLIISLLAMSNFQKNILKNEKGIWKYANFYNELIKPKNRLHLGENTDEKIKASLTREIEIGAINKLLAVTHLYFKREDENIYGSLKDRSLAYQVSLAKQNGQKELVISTSGNAGIAAATYCQKAGIKLYIFMSPETEKEKIVEMHRYNPILIESKKAIRLANYFSAKKKIENLRPSINDSSIEGFKSIAFELFENLGEIDALFTFVTSGSSFIGIGRAYEYLLREGEIKFMPRLYAVQSGGIFSVASEFEKIENNNLTESGKAGKLGVKNTRRKKEIIDIMKTSKGGGLYIASDEINKAKDILEKYEIYTSLEGCASFAGVMRIAKKEILGKIVCILSGKKRSNITSVDYNKIYKAESFEEMDRFMKEH